MATSFDHTRLDQLRDIAGGNIAGGDSVAHDKYNYTITDGEHLKLVWHALDWLAQDLAALSARVYWLAVTSAISATAALVVALVAFTLVLAR